MTREEAIKTLQHCGTENYCHHYIRTENCYGCNRREALDMAIEALSAERTGEWIDKGEYAECSVCGEHSGTQFDGVEPIPLKTNYCPNCGAIMKGGDSE